MPALPTYARYWAAKMWADLPEKTTPIIAAALKHWDDWHALTRDRVEELAAQITALDGGTGASLATKADKATTIAAGSGLDGGGSLAANRELSVEWGTGHEQVRRGDDAQIVNAVQRPAGDAATGALYVETADGTIERLTRPSPGLILGSGASTPTWQEPGSLGLGLPAAMQAGMIPVSAADGTWYALPPSTTQDSVLTADPQGADKLSWATPSAAPTATKRYAFTSFNTAYLDPATPMRLNRANRVVSLTAGEFFAILNTNRGLPLRNDGWGVVPPSSAPQWVQVLTLPPELRPAAEVISAHSSGGMALTSINHWEFHPTSDTSTTGRTPIDSGSQTGYYLRIYVKVATSGAVSLIATSAYSGASGYAWPTRTGSTPLRFAAPLTNVGSAWTAAPLP